MLAELQKKPDNYFGLLKTVVHTCIQCSLPLSNCATVPVSCERQYGLKPHAFENHVTWRTGWATTSRFTTLLHNSSFTLNGSRVTHSSIPVTLEDHDGGVNLEVTAVDVPDMLDDAGWNCTISSITVSPSPHDRIFAAVISAA